MISFYHQNTAHPLRKQVPQHHLAMKPHSGARRLTPHYEPEQSSLKPNDHEDETTTSKPDILKAGLLSLPPEIHLEISRRLIYPDALSLKQTNRHFYSLVDTGVELKIDWLVSRRKLHLECPNDKGCDLGSDLRFCRGSVAYVFSRFNVHQDKILMLVSQITDETSP